MKGVEMHQIGDPIGQDLRGEVEIHQIATATKMLYTNINLGWDNAAKIFTLALTLRLRTVRYLPSVGNNTGHRLINAERKKIKTPHQRNTHTHTTTHPPHQYELK